MALGIAMHRSLSFRMQIRQGSDGFRYSAANIVLLRLRPSLSVGTAVSEVEISC